MTASLPPLAVTTVGSWPRSPELLRAQKAKRAGRLDPAEFDRLADAAVRELLRVQEDCGIDLVTDGEQRRDSYFSFVAEKLDGVAMMTLADMLEIIEDKVAFERILQSLDVPAYSISNATCVGRVRRARPLVADDLRFAQQHTGKPIKVTLPGPYLLTRGMFVREACGHAYDSKEALGVDVVALLREELGELLDAGAAFIQFDEPVLTEVVFTQGQTRTFMCAALAAAADPAEELEFAVALLNQVTAGFAATSRGARIGLHICRGNWSTNEATLLRGGYHPLAPYLERMKVDQVVLEYATERAGELVPLAGKELGLGVINPRTPRIETVAEIRARIERALQHYPPERLFLNPDCGFATFSNRPVNSLEIAIQKMRAMVTAAHELRGGA
ncbi:MAG: cobalamin-independent methionine synthase II family protein [Gammaproteobacteria bacterium]|nr:cobalamin-independent methionine synthase II family protein [Gammaproteobacteria bacterium]